MTSRADLDQYIQQLKSGHEAGIIPAEPYYKELVTCAAELLESFGDLEASLVVLNQCPESYFQHIVAGQMLDDRFFSEIMTSYCYYLQKHGILDTGLEPLMQKPASA